MDFATSLKTFTTLTKMITKTPLKPDEMNEITAAITHVNELITKSTTELRATNGNGEYKCITCNQTNPLMFNRTKSKCTPCTSKSQYKNIKVKIDKGKERNITARISRKECVDCGLKVTRENALSFDWDHRNPAEKSFAISKMNYKSDELFYAEIAKCDITCRNCHIIKTKYQFDNNLIKKRQCKTAENLIVM